MRLSDTALCAQEIIGPLRRESFRREGAEPGPGDVAIGCGWSLTRACGDPLVVTAVAHVSGFPSMSLGVSLDEERRQRP